MKEIKHGKHVEVSYDGINWFDGGYNYVGESLHKDGSHHIVCSPQGVLHTFDYARKKNPSLKHNQFVWVWRDGDSRADAVVRCFSHFDAKLGYIVCYDNGLEGGAVTQTNMWDNYEIA